MVDTMSIIRAFVFLAASALIFDVTAATTFTVGSPAGGWDTTTDLQTWVSSQSFVVGDNLLFQYTPNHNVLEVTETNYDNCQPSNPIQMYIGGTTVIPLVVTGKRYFICGTSGHCDQGMKIEVDTLAGNTTTPVTPPPPASSPPPATTNPPPGSPPVTPVSSPPPTATTPRPPTGVSSPPPSSSATTVMSMVGSTLGLGIVSIMLLAL